MKLNERISHAWNAFKGDKGQQYVLDFGSGSGRPNHAMPKRYNSSSFTSSIFNRIAMDAATISIQHVKIDDGTEEKKDIRSGLHNCLNVEANIDQTGIQFMHDLVYSMFDEGVVAVVPVDTTISPKISEGYEINTMRVGKITQWYPKYVKVNLYNEITGNYEEITLPKTSVAIVENPLSVVVNGENATLTRLLKKMALIDNVDSMIASGTLDLIIQLPYAVKTELQATQAKERIERLEDQLNSNKHGIAYVDSTEKITQLSRPINDQLLDEVGKLSQEFYNQLGLTQNVFNGTASESEMRGYYTRTLDPIIDAITAEFKRKFLTKTARTQGHTLESYRDPFTLVPIEQIAEIADTMKRNAILSANEIRSIMGYKPSKQADADILANPNIADKNQGTAKTGSIASPDSKE